MVWKAQVGHSAIELVPKQKHRSIVTHDTICCSVECEDTQDRSGPAGPRGRGVCRGLGARRAESRFRGQGQSTQAVSISTSFGF